MLASMGELSVRPPQTGRGKRFRWLRFADEAVSTLSDMNSVILLHLHNKAKVQMYGTLYTGCCCACSQPQLDTVHTTWPQPSRPSLQQLYL